METRVRATYVSNSFAPDRRQFKPLFSPDQQQGRIKRETPRGTLEFLFSIFSNDIEIQTAVVGDSILNGICIDHCVVYSLPCGVINNFFELLPTLLLYRNIVFCAGGNNLSHFDNPGEAPEVVLEQMQDFVNALKAMNSNPTVVVGTVFKRLNATHQNSQNYNSLVTKRTSLRFFKLHQQVSATQVLYARWDPPDS